MTPDQLTTPAPLHNLRPVGGMPTLDGGWVRGDLVWRSAAPLARRMPASEAVAALGVGTVIDLRDAKERARTPGAWEHEALAVRPMPVFKDRLHEIRFDDLAELYAVMIEEAGSALAAAFAAVVDTAADGVLIHCTAGKDRTGVLSALLLDVVGVERSLVLEDFSQSQVHLGADYLADLFADIDANKLPGMAAHRATASPPELLAGAFSHIERGYGDTVSYLRAHGLTDRDVGRVHEVMRA